MVCQASVACGGVRQIRFLSGWGNLLEARISQVLPQTYWSMGELQLTLTSTQVRELPCPDFGTLKKGSLWENEEVETRAVWGQLEGVADLVRRQCGLLVGELSVPASVPGTSAGSPAGAGIPWRPCGLTSPGLMERLFEIILFRR